MKSNINKMFYTIEEQITYLAKVHGLKKGDMILTGTPEPIGQLENNDSIQARMYLQGKEIASINTKC